MARGFGKNRKTRSNPDTDTLWTTPWAWRDEECTYFGVDNSVWLYRTIPTNPMEWEDPQTRLSLGDQVATLLAEIGATSQAPAGGLKQFSNNREVHILSVTWEEEVVPPPSTPGPLADYMRSTFGFTAPKKSLFIGVRLRPAATSSSNASLMAQAKQVATKVLLEDVPDRELYAKDREFIHQLCSRAGGRKLTLIEQSQLESWYNLGRGPDVTIVEGTTSLEVSNIESYEISAVMKFGDPVMYAPNAQWALDAITHPHGPSVVSVRAELEPAVVSRSRARRSQRRIEATMREEAATGDLERIEYSTAFQQAQEFERFLVESNEPLLSSCSILMARPIRPADETYIDFLRNSYAIEVKPLEHRQLRALDEMLPCSTRRVNPFLQDVSISMIAHAGLSGFSNLGDRSGVYVGLANPDYTPVFLDPEGAGRENKPAGMLVAGDSGSGKTFLCQVIGLQAALAGYTTIFINPKGFDSLASFARLVGGQVVKMSALEASPGAFDPFRYAPPPVAAEIATNHILSVLGNEGGFTQPQQLQLGSALKRAAQAGGVRCVADAFPYVEDKTVVEQIIQQVEGSALFALGVGLKPMGEIPLASGLTLIEFDRKLDLPDASKEASTYTRPERIALAAIRLVTRASLEILMRSKGGVMIVDEAWSFLGHPEGKAALQQLGREGRSLNILPVFATQRVADVLDRDMEGYLSRVFCMKLSEDREAKAALSLCGLDPTPARVEWLKSCGPRRGDADFPDRPALSLHRDMYDRHSAVVIAPVPEAVRLAISTNTEDRRLRETNDPGSEAPGGNG